MKEAQTCSPKARNLLKKAFSISLVAVVLPVCFAAEADHYTQRGEALNDMLPVINSMANDYLKKSINNVNKQGVGCSEKELYKEMRLYFNNHSKGQLVIDALHKDKVEKRIIPLKQSIYENWNIADGFLLGRKSAASSPLALSPMVKMGDFVIGIDKLEHMFGMGFQYFSDYYLKEKKISRVLNKGIFYEKTILGGNIIATGVFAYADLAANFNGMRFWNSVLGKREDILGQKISPYLSCSDGKFVQVGSIDFSKFIDASFDESINCSKFARNRSVKKVFEALDKRSKLKGVEYKCPMDEASYDSLLKKYDIPAVGSRKGQSLADFIINGEGIERRSFLNEF
jgi:hypothetical protein